MQNHERPMFGFILFGGMFHIFGLPVVGNVLFALAVINIVLAVADRIIRAGNKQKTIKAANAPAQIEAPPAFDPLAFYRAEADRYDKIGGPLAEDVARDFRRLVVQEEAFQDFQALLHPAEPQEPASEPNPEPKKNIVRARKGRCPMCGGYGSEGAVGCSCSGESGVPVDERRVCPDCDGKGSAYDHKINQDNSCRTCKRHGWLPTTGCHTCYEVRKANPGKSVGCSECGDDVDLSKTVRVRPRQLNSRPVVPSGARECQACEGSGRRSLDPDISCSTCEGDGFVTINRGPSASRRRSCMVCGTTWVSDTESAFCPTCLNQMTREGLVGLPNLPRNPAHTASIRSAETLLNILSDLHSNYTQRMLRLGMDGSSPEDHFQKRQLLAEAWEDLSEALGYSDMVFKLNTDVTKKDREYAIKKLDQAVDRARMTIAENR